MSVAVTVQLLSGDVLPFTIHEGAEIADLKMVIAQHFQVSDMRLTLSRQDDLEDVSIVCKDYHEVESGHYHLLINDPPTYTFHLEDNLLMLRHPSGETPCPRGAQSHYRYWHRYLNPDQPYRIEVHLPPDASNLLILHLQQMYDDEYHWYQRQELMRREVAIEDRAKYIPSPAPVSLIPPHATLSSLVELFVQHVICPIFGSSLPYEIIFP
jgi:hypothetical protein